MKKYRAFPSPASALSSRRRSGDRRSKLKTALEGFIPVGLATLAACQSDEIEKSEEILRVEHLAIGSLLDLVKSGSFELFSNIRTAGATIFGAEEVVEEGSTDKCTSGSNSEEETLVIVLSFDHLARL